MEWLFSAFYPRCYGSGLGARDGMRRRGSAATPYAPSFWHVLVNSHSEDWSSMPLEVGFPWLVFSRLPADRWPTTLLTNQLNSNYTRVLSQKLLPYSWSTYLFQLVIGRCPVRISAEQRFFWQWFIMAPSVTLFRPMSGWYKTGHDPFLPHPLQFIIHQLSHYSTWKHELLTASLNISMKNPKHRAYIIRQRNIFRFHC